MNGLKTFEKSLLLLGGMLLAPVYAIAQDGQVEPEPGAGEFERLHGEDVEEGLGGHASHSDNVGTSSEVGDVGAPDQVANSQSDNALGEVRGADGEDSSASYVTPGSTAETASRNADAEDDTES